MSKTAVTKVLCCFFVFMILMSVVQVSVLASDSSADAMGDVLSSLSVVNTQEGVVESVFATAVSTGNDPRDDSVKALARFIHPGAKCDLVGPKVDTTLLKDTKYTFIFWLKNEKGITEAGKDAKVVVQVINGKIEIELAKSTDYFMNVKRWSERKVVFSDSGGKEFKKGGMKAGVFNVVPTDKPLSVKITAEIKDITEGENPSTHEVSITYNNIAELSADRSKVLEDLSNLASSRSKVTGTYIGMYQNFIDSGEPFKELSVDDYSYYYVDQARFAGELAGAAEVGLNWMVVPATGMVSGFTGIINKIFGVPSVLDGILAMPYKIDRTDRVTYYHDASSCQYGTGGTTCENLHKKKEYGNIHLAPLSGKRGALNFLKRNQIEESNAWKNGKIEEAIDLLNKELELVRLSECIASYGRWAAGFRKDKTGNKTFDLILDHLEHEKETISKLIKIADDMPSEGRPPKPQVDVVDPPLEIALGEKAVIEIKGVNQRKGGPCYGYLGLAFPDLNAEVLEQNPSPVRIVEESTTAPHPKIFYPGNLVIQDYGRKFIPELNYVLVSFESAGINGYNKPEYWSKDNDYNDYTLCVEVEPVKAGDFHYEYKMVTFIAGPSSYRADPAIDSNEKNREDIGKDQQNEKVYKRKIKVVQNKPPNKPSNPTPSDGATEVDINMDLKWSGGDPDAGDTVTYDVYFGSSANPSKVSSAQSGTTYGPSMLEYNTEYYWKIEATDKHGKSTSGSLWDFTTGSIPNNPPKIPSIPSGPISGNTGTSYAYYTSATDPEDDQVKYTFDWGDDTTETYLENSGTRVGKTHSWSNEGTYYVKAKATDHNGASSDWSSPLTVTITKSNNPPNTPSNPSPTNGVIDVDINTDLKWSGGDPDAGDTLTYDVYFGSSENPSKVSSAQSGTTYDPDMLEYNTKYHWKIEATDNHGKSTTGSLWDFTTGSIPNNPPNTPSTPSGPDSGTPGTPYTYSTSATDPEGDQVKYTFDWGDHTTSKKDCMASGATVSMSHKWDRERTYSVKVLATDSKGASSGWSDSKIVKIATPTNPPNTPSNPSPPNGATDIDINADLKWTGGDPDAGDTVTYDVFLGTTPDLHESTRHLSVSIFDPGPLSPNTKYYWQIFATDNHGVHIVGPLWTFTTGATLNKPPYWPSEPLGPRLGYTETSYSYSTSAVDLDEDPVKYTFDWDDGTTFETGFAKSGTKVSGSHSWICSGIYHVRVKSTDIKGASIWWSDPKEVMIEPKPNDPPTTPSEPSGQSSGYTEISYKYSTSAADPDDHQVKYTFDWGDDSTSETEYVDSGTTASMTHSWNNAGTYSLKVKATDSKGKSSGWSSSRTVTITTSGSQLNRPPNMPSNPSPQNHATDQSIHTDLSWTGGDPDAGDSVTYAVYFGSWPPLAPPLVSTDLPETTYDPGTLNPDTQYYWIIIATDNHGDFTAGPLWDFTTSTDSSDRDTIPPETKCTLSPSSPDGEKGWYVSPVTVTLESRDPSGIDWIKYRIDSNPWQTSPGSKVSFTVSNEGFHFITHYAKDKAGNEENQKISDFFHIDQTEPSASLSINSGAESTNSRSVTLHLSYSDATLEATSGVKDCRYKNEGESWTSWESCSSTKSWTLTAGEGTKKVYYQVRDNAGNIKEVSDIITLQEEKLEPKLCTAPDPPSINFGTVAKDQTRTWDFFITNCGSGTLTWTITCDQPSWLKVNPASGSTTILDVVTVTIDTHDLSPGTHTGQITITSNGGEKTGTITVNVPSKQSTPNVGFKGIVLFPCTYSDFTGQGIEVTNILSDPNGKLANGKNVCTYWTENTLAQIDNVACGDEVEVYGTLIEDPDVAEDWLIVRLETSTHYIVRLKQGPPQLCTSPTTPSHDFGTVAKDQTRTWDFDIRNCGSGTLTWSVSDDKNRMSVYPTSGSTTTERDTVTVTISTSGLSPGTYTGHITLTSNGGEKTGTITVVVPKPKPQNKPPENPTLTPNKAEPQNAGTSITWTASATDPDGDTLYYQFWIKGPATGNSWTIKRDWSSAKTWTWYTTASDVGDTDITVWIRDRHHASTSSYDLKKTVYDYKINSVEKKRPTATINSITPNPATRGDDTVRFKGHGYDSDGYIVEYYWKSSKDGKLSSSKEFTKSASKLAVATHTIYFKVKDDDGLWSDWATATLKIKKSITGKPDLIVSSIKFKPNPASAGDDVVVSVTVKNQGKGDAGAHDEFLGQPYATVIHKEWHCSGLKSGASKTFTHTLKNFQGSVTYEACADWGGVVEESDEDNNCRTAYLEDNNPI